MSLEGVALVVIIAAGVAIAAAPTSMADATSPPEVDGITTLHLNAAERQMCEAGGGCVLITQKSITAREKLNDKRFDDAQRCRAAINRDWM